MLTPDQIELIHKEVDGENTAVESAAFRTLVEREPEARALEAELRSLAAAFQQAGDRVPHPRLRPAILEAVEHARNTWNESVPASARAYAIPRWMVLQWSSLTTRMEETMVTKKGLIIGTTTVAAVAIVGALVVGYPPSGGEVGTIGGADTTIAGVQQASRYRGRSMSAEDVSLSNPEIQAIFQNHEIVALVQSEVFRAAMRNDAFRELQSNDAFRALMAQDAFRALMAQDAFRALMSSDAQRALLSQDAMRALMAQDAFRALLKQDAFRAMQSSDAMRALQANDQFRALQANDAFRALLASDAFRAAMANDAFRAAMANDAFRAAMSSDAFRAAMANDAFRAAMANDAFRSLMAQDAFRALLANEAFRALSRSQSASDAFLNEAMRAAQ